MLERPDFLSLQGGDDLLLEPIKLLGQALQGNDHFLLEYPQLLPFQCWKDLLVQCR